MPQFWRVLHVLQRLTHGWESSFGGADLLSAYTIKSDGHHRYYPFLQSRGDKVLVLTTQVKVCLCTYFVITVGRHRYLSF